MKKFVITNNPLVKEKLSEYIEINYFDITYLDILKKVRDKVHKGYKLLTHPLSGSLKPNETPYKSIIIGHNNDKLDMESLMIIESSIQTAEKFIKDKNTPNWNEKILKDFQVIDISLIEQLVKEL
ncbi:GrdX family protein [Thermohalobacter berrensis]|uniref:GrdX protein n=1 Tax=Thermohalobacter berrensis TaxID=99594 RepID=A0A419SV42_9FIRM|nr:GrdX family protein [Thermohalobacter berrensis]RKD29098.1 GrdX protein [Thermohalobacter berrensis]